MNNEKKQSNRLLYFDAIRVVATIGVILIHVYADYLVNMKDMARWNIANAIDVTFRFSVPIFFMLSGALLCAPKDESIEVFFRKRFKKVVIPFMFWSVLCGLIARSRWTDITAMTILSVIKEIPMQLTYYHLWFMYVIVVLYTFVPIIRVYTKWASDNNLLYFICLIFIPYSISVVYFTLFKVPLYWTFVTPNICLYLGYFLLGYYLRVVDIPQAKRKKLYILGIGSLVFNIIGSIVLSVRAGGIDITLYDYSIITTVFVAIAVFVLFKNLDVRGFADNYKKIWAVIQSISECSFGIYLVHPIIQTAKIPGHNATIQEIVVSPIGESLTLFFVSWGVVYLCRQIKYVRGLFG